MRRFLLALILACLPVIGAGQVLSKIDALQKHTAGWVNVKEYGAICNGSADDTAAVASAYAALPSAGGELRFPAGTCKLNLTIARTGVSLVGAGSGDPNAGTGATKLIPAITTSPVLTFGNGTTLYRGNGLENFVIVGDGVTATGDGVKLVGLYEFSARNVTIASFGRDNLVIQSSAGQPTALLHFASFTSSYARRSCVRAEYGAQYVTGVYFTNTHINGWSGAGSHAVYSDGVALGFANSYIDVGGDGIGHVYLARTGAANPAIYGANLTIDAVSTRVGVELGWAGVHVPSSWLLGSIHLSGKIKWSDATTYDGTGGPAGTGSDAYISQLNAYSIVPEGIYLPDTAASAHWDGASAPTVKLSRSGASLVLDGANITISKASPIIAASAANDTLSLTGTRTAADSGADVAIGSGGATRTAGNLVAIRNNGTNVLTLGFSGKTGLTASSFLDDSANTGSRTVNLPYGRNAFAAGTATLTITNNLVTATSLVFVVLQTNDATARLANVVPAAGSFAVNLTANATGTTKFAWFVIN